MRYGDPLPHATTSVCPVCNRILPAIVYKSGNEVRIKRVCPEHGEFDEVYYEDVEIYERFRKFAKYNKRCLSSFQVNELGELCPFQCGLCARHISFPSLANIVVTNRCELNCWYCFFRADVAGFVYEPTIEQIEEMLKLIRSTKPVSCGAVQFTGGEPLLRDDIFEILRIAKEKYKFPHVQLNTSGIQIFLHPEYVPKFKPYVNTIYMSFDGVSPETNPKNHWEMPKILETLKKNGGPGVVLVPTLIRGMNTHELGDIIAFAVKNSDVVQGVNFQPISFTGMARKSDRKKFRITIPGAIKMIEEQTNGVIPKEAWVPVPAAIPISELIKSITGEEYPFNSHFACGAATYIFPDRKRGVISIADFLDIDGLLEHLWKYKGKKLSMLDKFRIVSGALKFFDASKAPEKLNPRRLLLSLLSGKIDAFFEARPILLGLMHFMDKYNYDVERVEMCVIPYATPDGRLIPFCAFNIFPELYRDAIQRAYSVDLKEWEKVHGKTPKYVRKKEFMEEIEKSAMYKKYYSLKGFWDEAGRVSG